MFLFAFANKILIYHICCVSIKDLSRREDGVSAAAKRSLPYDTRMTVLSRNQAERIQDRRMIEGHSRRVFSRRHAWQDGVRSTTPPSRGRRRSV